MAFYNLQFKKSAERELRAISPPDLRRVTQRIHALAEMPRPSGAQLLRGEGRYWRVRQGDYRIVYDVDDASRTVTIIKIGHRREVYD